MKKFYLLLTLMLLTLGIGNAWGAEVTFDATKDKGSSSTGAVSYEKEGITLSVENGALGNGTDYRVYKNTKLTITSSVGDITNIALTYKSASYDGGGWATSYQPNADSWTSPTASGEQARITKIVVTYTPSGSGETPEPDPDPTPDPETPGSQSTATLIVGENGGVTWTNGAKTAEATADYLPNYCVVTWAGGCGAYKKTDWEPLRNKKIILIPDADNKKGLEWEEQPGMKAMNGIAHILSNKGCSVRIVDTRAMAQIKDGWDIADALEAGMAQEELVKFIKANIYDYVDKKKNESFAPEEIMEEKHHNFYYDTTYFKCLGVKGDKHYFYNKKTGQIHSFSPGNYDSKHLVGLAPLVYWQSMYPAKSKEGTDWLNVADALCRIQEQVGIFDETKIRGRGAWFDDGEPVLHLGSCLFVKNQIREIDSYDSQYFYEKSPSLAVSLQTVLTKEQGKEFIDLCKLIRWDKEYYGEVLAGWLFSSLVCGAMPFRSHLYLIGAAGSGKSWIFDNIIKPVMGNIALSVSSKSTEAGIREALRGDVRPVIFDEAEAENTTDKIRMQAVFDIARQASSENADAIVKGTAGRGGLSYICRSAFLFASINNSMSKSADLSRTAFVSLSNPPVGKDEEAKKQDNEKFKLLEEKSSILLDDDFQRCFLTRAIQMIPVMRESHKIIANVSAKKFGSRRLGDQMGMVLAGLWCLQNDTVITEDDALKIIQQTSMQVDKADDEITQEERCRELLLHTDIKLYNNAKYNISYLLGILFGIVQDEMFNKKNLEEWLGANGVRLKDINGITYALFAKNDTSIASRMFKDTEWEFSWATALLRIEDILDVKRTMFHFSLRSNAIAIPLRQIIIEGGFDAEIL